MPISNTYQGPDMTTVENQLIEMNETLKEMRQHQKETNELLVKICETLIDILKRT